MGRKAIWLAVWGFPVLLSAQDGDSIQTIYHNPPTAMLNDRPYRMRLLVNLDPATVSAVTLFMKSDSSQTYQEIKLPGRDRTRTTWLQPESLSGDTLYYYFVVDLVDGGGWAYPLDNEGEIDPFVIPRVPPSMEYFQQRLDQ